MQVPPSMLGELMRHAEAVRQRRRQDYRSRGQNRRKRRTQFRHDRVEIHGEPKWAALALALDLRTKCQTPTRTITSS
jgi:hypothetical protein